MIRDYGVQAPNALAYLPQTAPAGLTRLESAQIHFAMEHEMAQSLADLLFVSTYWGYERKWNPATLEPFASAMGLRLGWDEQRRAQEITACLES